MQCFIYLPFQKFKDIFFVENSSSDIRIRFLINIIVSAEDLNEQAPKIMFSFLAAVTTSGALSKTNLWARIFRDGTSFGIFS